MKKAFSILLVLVMALSLCACGAKMEEAVVGEWTFSESKTYNGRDYTATTTLVIYKGGTGVFWKPGQPYNLYEPVKYNMTWEIKDGVLNIETILGVDGFEYDASAKTLTRLDKSLTLTRK